jgi:hypothetical protein
MCGRVAVDAVYGKEDAVHVGGTFIVKNVREGNVKQLVFVGNIQSAHGWLQRYGWDKR